MKGQQLLTIFKCIHNISFTPLYRKIERFHSEIHIYIFTSNVPFHLFPTIQLSSTKWHSRRHSTSKDDDARDRAYSLAIGSAFASHPFLIRRITKRARVTGAREQVANASSFIARAKRIVSKRAERARRLDALRLVGPP